MSGRAFKAVADATHQHPETVRRYLSGQTPSTEFLVALCTAYGVNSDWLVSGLGPMRVKDVRTHALREASDADLLGALADTIDVLNDRIDRVESVVRDLGAARSDPARDPASPTSLPGAPAATKGMPAAPAKDKGRTERKG